MSQFAKFPASGGGGGSVFWKDASSSVGTLPTGSSTGELRQTLDTQDIYRWDGAAWQLWLDYSDGALLDSHISATAAHGATGAVVGTTNSQTLTNKTIVAANNTITTAASGALVATDLNAALAELDGDITTVAGNLSSHESDTSTHGVTTVAGVSESQTLTNKTIVAANNTITTAASGNLVATELDAALAELQADIDTRAPDADLTTHENLTAAHGTTGSVVGTSDTQTLTNKTVVAASNTITTASSGNLTSTELNAALAELQSDIDTRLVDELTTKGDLLVRGTSAEQRLAVGTDGQVLKADSSATNGVAWGDANSGGINYSENPDFESTITTGVTDGTNITSAAETTNEIRGTQSLRWDIGTGVLAGAFGALTLKTIDPTDKGKALTLSFEYATDTDYTSDDVEIRIYDNTNTSYINVNATEDFDGMLKATGGVTDSRKFIGQWYAADDSDDYEVRFYVNSAPSTASQIIVDNVRVGPESFYNMPIVSEWQSYTLAIDATTTAPTVSTAAVNKAMYRRVGDAMEIEYTLHSSTPAGTAGSGTYLFPLPSGYTVDSDLVSVAADTNVAGTVGVASVYASSPGTSFTGVAIAYSTTKLALVVGNETYSPAIVSSAFLGLGITDTLYKFTATVPIAEWANSSTTMSTTQANLQTVKAIYTRDSAQTITGTISIVDYDDKTKDTHNAVTTGASWKFTAPTKMVVDVKASMGLTSSSGWAEGETSALYVYKNGSLAKYLDFQYCPWTATQILMLSGSTEIELEAGDYIDIRAVQNSGAGVNTDTTATFNQVSITQQPDFTTIGVYSPYEVVELQGQPFTYPSWSAGVWLDIGSFTLTPGTYDVKCIVKHRTSSGSAPGAASDVYTHIHTVSGNNAGTLTYGNNASVCPLLNSILIDLGHVFDSEITVTETTTYYLKQKCDITPAASSVRLDYYSVKARRRK